MKVLIGENGRINGNDGHCTDVKPIVAQMHSRY